MKYLYYLVLFATIPLLAKVSSETETTPKAVSKAKTPKSKKSKKSLAAEKKRQAAAEAEARAAEATAAREAAEAERNAAIDAELGQSEW